MTLAEIIMLAIQASLFIMVFAIGLQCTRDDALYLFRKPGLLFRSLFAMNGLMLILVIGASLVLDIAPQLKAALVGLALAPVPPILPGKQQKAGGSASYVIGLLFAAAVISIVLVPVSVEIIGRIFGQDAHVPILTVAKAMLLTVVVPLALGIAARRFIPALAQHTKIISTAGVVLLVAACVPIIIKAWPPFEHMIGNGVILVLVLFSAVGLLVGHWLGGPDPHDRTALAIATATRHPAVAIVVASQAAAADQSVPSVILFHLVIASLVALPYVAWRKRVHAAGAVS